MKFTKIFSVLGLAAAIFGSASCSKDVTDPKFHEPDNSSFTVYNSAFQDQYYKLTPGNTFEITLSGQPDYGFSAVTCYRCEVSLTEDFKESKVLVPVGTGTLSKMVLKDSDLASALTAFQGVSSPDEYQDLGEQKVYFRGQAYIDGVEGSFCTTSNYTTLNRVQSYYYVPKPGVLYVVGNYAGDWIAPMPANEASLMMYALTEKTDEIGSKVYYGTVSFQNDAPMFRFYTALGSWDENSIGCASAAAEPTSDNPQKFEDYTGGEFKHALAQTKDSFSFPNFKAGSLNIVVDMSNAKDMKMTITSVE